MANIDTQFKPGQSGNPAGRPKGSRNKTTAEQKEIIHAFLTDNWDKVVECMEQQQGHKYIDSFVKLAKFVWPTMTKNENENTSTGEVSITVEYLSQPSTRKGELVQDKPVEVDGPSVPKFLAMEDLDIQKNSTDS